MPRITSIIMGFTCLLFGALIMFGLAASVQAQSDARLQTIIYNPEQIFPVSVAPGYQVAILLASDEKIQNVAVGDNTSWQVSANTSGNSIFVKLADAGYLTNMTVITNIRSYNFELIPLRNLPDTAPYTIQFRYPSQSGKIQTSDNSVIVGFYKLSGDRSLFPETMEDDGQKTFIYWRPDQDLPAVYSVDASGNEVIVNGMMRGSYYVIDRVSDKILFRTDKRKANARRQLGETSQ
jgi:type IV secretion system protein VirB9